MSDMLYIAHFARAQLKAAQEKGMEGEQLAALLNALYAEAEALTHGGGYIVTYVAKEMDLPPGPIALRNAYLFTCVVGCYQYFHEVVEANILSPALIDSTVSKLRQIHAAPNSSFQFAGVTPLGMISREGLREEQIVA